MLGILTKGDLHGDVYFGLVQQSVTDFDRVGSRLSNRRGVFKLTNTKRRAQGSMSRKRMNTRGMWAEAFRDRIDRD